MMANFESRFGIDEVVCKEGDDKLIHKTYIVDAVKFTRGR